MPGECRDETILSDAFFCIIFGTKYFEKEGHIFVIFSFFYISNFLEYFCDFLNCDFSFDCDFFL